MDVSSVQFPNQRLTDAEKIKAYGSIEEWGRHVLESLIGVGSQVHYQAYDETYRDQINYNLLAGHINDEDFKYVTKPYGVSSTYNFPATFTNYNIITPKISLLEGEESKRPFNFRVVATDMDSTNQISRQKTQMIKTYFKSVWEQELQAQGVNVQDPEAMQQMTPPEVEKYFQRNYQSMRELNAQQSLEFLYRYLELNDKFNTAWRDLLTTGKEIYYVGLVDDEPYVEVVNPVYFKFDRNPDLKYIEDSAWAYREYYISPADVYDRWGEFLSEKDIDYIEQIKGGRDGFTVNNSSINVPIRYQSDIDDGGGNGGNIVNIDSTVFVPVIHFEWKSLKKVFFVTTIDESGQTDVNMYDETYKPDPYDETAIIEVRWVNTVYEGTRIGKDLFVNVREKPNQYRSMDNPNRCKLGYTGLCYNARNSQPYSMVEIMKPHQYLYNILLYRMELEVARAQGKKLIFDLAQIPTSEGMDLERWMYYFNVLSIGFINSFEEGKGKFAGERPTFNQFQQIDMSMANVINQYVMMLDKIENMVGEISGVSKQRQGQIASSETVGGVERSVQQSSYITEPLFIAHNFCKQHVLTNLLEVSKLAWSQGKKINYVMDDMTRILLEIDGTEFVNAEYGVFVANNAKDDQILEQIKQVAQYAMSSGQASLKDIVSILESQNITKAKIILEESRQEALKVQEQTQQHEKELQDQQLQAQMQQHQADLDFQDKINQRDNDVKIQVAIIGAESAQEAKQPEDKSGELALKAKELADKRALKERELSHKENLDNKELEHTKEVDNRDLEHTKNIDKEDLAHTKSIDQKDLSHRQKLERQKLELEQEIERERLAAEKSAKEKELKQNVALEKAKLKQQDHEHQREQETKIETEKIKAEASVQAAKVAPKPKPSK